MDFVFQSHVLALPGDPGDGVHVQARDGETHIIMTKGQERATLILPLGEGAQFALAIIQAESAREALRRHIAQQGQAPRVVVPLVNGVKVGS